MLTTKIDRLNACPSNATNDNATMIDGNAINNGTTPATTVPNTNNHTDRPRAQAHQTSPVQHPLLQQWFEAVFPPPPPPPRAHTPRAPPPPPHRPDHIIDPRTRLIRHRELHQRRVPIRRNQRR